jgi:hypothetical protein
MIVTDTLLLLRYGAIGPAHSEDGYLVKLPADVASELVACGDAVPVAENGRARRALAAARLATAADGSNQYEMKVGSANEEPSHTREWAAQITGISLGAIDQAKFVLAAARLATAQDGGDGSNQHKEATSAIAEVAQTRKWAAQITGDRAARPDPGRGGREAQRIDW